MGFNAPEEKPNKLSHNLSCMHAWVQAKNKRPLP